MPYSQSRTIGVRHREVGYSSSVGIAAVGEFIELSENRILEYSIIKPQI